MALWKPTCAVKLAKSLPPIKFLGLLLISLFLSSCVSLYDPESSHEWHTDRIYTLQPNEIATQSLVLSQASLSKITLWITPVAQPVPADARITLTLIDLNNQPKYLLSLSQPLQACSQAQCTFSIGQNQFIPKGKYAIGIESSTAVHLWGSLLNSYPKGNFSINHQETSSDLAFSIEYRYTSQSLLGDIARVGSDLWLLLPSLALLITPGLLIIKFLRLSPPDDQSLSLYLVISTSIAFLAVGMAWTSLFNLHWHPTLVRLLFYGCSLMVIILAIRNLRPWLKKFQIEDFFLLLIFWLALFIRLLMARNLIAPPWVDSVHHALITSLILDEGAYPSTYAPYLDLSTTSYHSGFHANLAFFTWLSALPLPTSMLVFGQILNALAVYSAYTFTLAFYPNRFAGIVAAALVAFFSPMPAYYTSWGRYTQLCGLLILPTIIYLFNNRIPLNTDLLSKETQKTLLLVSLLISGLIIIHYRVSYFCALLLGLSALGKLFHPSGNPKTVKFLRLIAIFCMIGFIVLLLSAPWLPEALFSLLLPKFTAWSNPPATTESVPIGLLTPALGRILLALAAMGFVLETLRRSWNGVILTLWMALCFATIYLSNFVSKGIGFLNMTSVTISLYLPLSALGGAGIYHTLQWLRGFYHPRSRWLPLVLSFCAILVSAILGGRALMPLLNPITMLVRADDLQAMNFIRSATQPDQKFLIQPFLWGYGLYAGHNGGSWIPALANRSTIPPPVLFALSDRSEQVRQINQISQKVLEKPNDPTWIASLMRENNLQYLYLGGRGGAISAWTISQSPDFDLIYHQGSVFIFKLLPQRTHR